MEIGSKNLQIRVDDTENIELVAGTYTAGQIVVEDAALGTYSFIAITDDTRAFVLLEDVTTATDGVRGVGATGVFNQYVANIQQVTVTPALDAILQKKGIILKAFNKEA